MGEFADMIINGLVDQYTGEVIDGHSSGYPRSLKRNKKRHRKSDGNFRCEKCGRYFQSTKSVEHHNRDMHTVDGQERRRKQKQGY